MKRSRAYLASLISLVLVLSSVTPAVAATQSELDASRQRAADARKQADAAQATADALRKEVEALDAEIAALETEVHVLDPQIADATARTKKLDAEVTGLRAKIAEKEAEISRVQADLVVQQELLDRRLASTYKQGDLFYLDLLLNAQDFSDLIARTTLVQRVIRSDQDIATQLGDTKTDLEARKTELARTLDDVQIKLTEAETVEKKLRTMRTQRQSVVDARESVQGKKSALVAENQANADKLRQLAEEEEAEADKIAAELANRGGGGSGAYNGVMAWPVPGFYRITSPYGPRICPFHGQELHPGIDVGRNTDPPQAIDGAAIVAAGDGEVIQAGYRGGYGYTVMIDHGDGLVTLYAHQQGGGIMVSVGQRVSKGERIGTVGSSGNSTGPHLHFETRVNGTPVNPLKYVG